MQTKDFYFDLPEELIAQTPSEIRGQDKLLVMDKLTGKVEHHKMEDLIDLIDEMKMNFVHRNFLQFVILLFLFDFS